MITIEKTGMFFLYESKGSKCKKESFTFNCKECKEDKIKM